MDYQNLSKKELGNLGESLAADYLQRAGLKIVKQNYRCPKGEIDIVAREGDFLVFIEVRTRTSSFRGTAEESVGYRKMQKLRNIASYYLLEKNYSHWPPLRFDVVAINISGGEAATNWIRNVGI